jgi:hypothetical protein
MDAGTDHLSQSVLASSAIRTNTAGLRWQFGKHWTLSAEAWSSRFALSGSPDEILSTSSAPVPTYLLSTNSQWNTLIRLSRQFKWGGGRSLDDVSQWAAARMPLVGSIVGFVQEEGSQGNRPASYVTLTLDNWKSAVTDLRGYYEFMQVSEGTHHVSIDMRRLPVDYEPAAAMATTALVRPQGRARADFVVYPLCTIKGVVHGPDALTMGSIVIRLEPGDQRTTPNELGQFYFEGLRESDYTIVIDKSSLPPDAVLRSEERQPIRATVGAPAFVEYQVEIVPPQKPVKTIP